MRVHLSHLLLRSWGSMFARARPWAACGHRRRTRSTPSTINEQCVEDWHGDRCELPAAEWADQYRQGLRLPCHVSESVWICSHAAEKPTPPRWRSCWVADGDTCAIPVIGCCLRLMREHGQHARTAAADARRRLCGLRKHQLYAAPRRGRGQLGCCRLPAFHSIYVAQATRKMN